MANAEAPNKVPHSLADITIFRIIVEWALYTVLFWQVNSFWLTLTSLEAYFWENDIAPEAFVCLWNGTCPNHIRRTLGVCKHRQ